MAFHSEIKVNYQVLQEIVADLKKYETALISMEKSIANMDKVISENEGKTFDALRKVKHDFDGEIRTCKEEIRDIYGRIVSRYVRKNLRTHVRMIKRLPVVTRLT